LFRWLYKSADRVRDIARRRVWNKDHALGRRAEDLTHRYLQRRGMTVVARNYKTPAGSGELDVVAYEGPTLVVVEVKSRSSLDFGPPERNVDFEKEYKLMRGAEDFARRAGVPLTNVRFDIVSVVFTGGKPEIRHFEDVFHPDENTPFPRLV
jgi:putative endonuclease